MTDLSENTLFVPEDLPENIDNTGIPDDFVVSGDGTETKEETENE